MHTCILILQVMNIFTWKHRCVYLLIFLNATNSVAMDKWDRRSCFLFVPNTVFNILYWNFIYYVSRFTVLSISGFYLLCFTFSHNTDIEILNFTNSVEYQNENKIRLNSPFCPWVLGGCEHVEHYFLWPASRVQFSFSGPTQPEENRKISEDSCILRERESSRLQFQPNLLLQIPPSYTHVSFYRERNSDWDTKLDIIDYGFLIIGIAVDRAHSPPPPPLPPAAGILFKQKIG